MTETTEQTQYRSFGARGADGSAAWPDAVSCAPLRIPAPSRDGAARADVSEKDSDDMSLYGITRQYKAMYTYKAYDYERLADALAYARIDTARPGPSARAEEPGN